MAVVGSPTILHDGHSGTYEADRREITVNYHVIVDDVADGPNVVVRAVGLPLIGSIYNVGNDLDVLMTCETLRPSRVDGSRYLWNVAATYRSPNSDENQGKNPKGLKEKDPLKWRDEIDISYSTNSRPLESAVFMGAMLRDEAIQDPSRKGSDTPGRAANKRGMVTNSAGQVYSPAYEQDISRFLLRITKMSKGYPAKDALVFKDAVNKRTWTINKPQLGFRLVCPQYTAKILNIGGALEYHEDQSYWKLHYEFSLDFDFGWCPTLPDQGHYSLFGTGPKLSDYIKPVRSVTDLDGMPLTDAQPLDGHGRFLLDKKPDWVMRYEPYNLQDFSKLKI